MEKPQTVPSLIIQHIIKIKTNKNNVIAFCKTNKQTTETKINIAFPFLISYFIMSNMRLWELATFMSLYIWL